MALNGFEQGNTVEFTFVSSVAPDSAPVFGVVQHETGTIVASITSQQSDTTHYYALFTMPGSIGYYRGEWNAVRTFNSSAYQFKKRFGFKVHLTSAT